MLESLILLIACVNFINLMTARAARRSREVGIRKLAGAGRHLLMLQFLGESTLYVLTAMLAAVAFTEWSLPYVNAFLGFDASLIIGAIPRCWPACLPPPRCWELWPASILPSSCLGSGR